MNPSDEKVIEVARRTRKNLEYIYAQYDLGAPVYEFAQLLNSLFGLLICLREDYYYGSTIEWVEVERRLGMPVPVEIKLKCDTFSHLITNVRNALAHSNYNFLSASDNKINGVELWTMPRDKTDPKYRKKRQFWEWSATLSEDDLRAIAYLALNYLEAIFGQTINGEPSDPSDAPQM